MIKAIVIPARYRSTRFLGKPLVSIAGISMIQRVWQSARKVTGVDHLLVATDDERIAQHVRDFGGNVIITPEHCENGTARVSATLQIMAAQGTKIDAVLNVQGDAVLTPPWVMQSLIDALGKYPIVTPAVQLNAQQYEALKISKTKKPSSGTLVTFDKNGMAMYFSKQIIPFMRQMPESGILPVYRHIGLYGYTSEALARWLHTPPTVLEEVEQLEQLRMLENGIPIKVIIVNYNGRTHASIDNPADVAEVEEIIKREGELI